MNGVSITNEDGIVYVLVNEAMPGYVKIGKTKDIGARIRSLDNTSVPVPFTCFFAAQVEKYDFIEHQLHDVFGDHRVRSNREFFRVSPERVVSAIKITSYKDVTPSVDFVETPEDQKALDWTRARRPVFRFSSAKIPHGAILVFTRDQKVTCVVIDDKKVLMNGLEVSLSRAADIALRQLGISWKSVQGPAYWEYEGEILDERRTRIASEEDYAIDAAGDAYTEEQADIQRGK